MFSKCVHKSITTALGMCGKHFSITPENVLGANTYLRMPELLSRREAVCQISVMYPPLNPKGRMRGSRSKLDETDLIDISFSVSGINPLLNPWRELNAPIPAAAIPVVL